jgi:hypothetical protein
MVVSIKTEEGQIYVEGSTNKSQTKIQTKTQMTENKLMVSLYQII